MATVSNMNYKLRSQDSTVSEKDVSRFNGLVDVWWKGLKMLHKMNQVRVPFIQEELKKMGKLDPEAANTDKPLRGISILDVGCGGGILTEELAKLGAKVTGLDPAPELIKCAALHASSNDEIKSNIHYVCDIIEDFAERNEEKFDAVVASQIIEHIQNVDLFLQSCIKALKPGGSLFVTTINRTKKSWMVGIMLYEHILKIVSKGFHKWNKFVQPEDLLEVLDKYDCEAKFLSGWEYNTFSETWSRTPSKSVFYRVHAVKV